MSRWREGIADFLTKGQFTALRKDYDTLKTSIRPGLGAYETARGTEPRGLFNTAYYLEQNCSIFSDIVLTKKQECFRNGLSWKPAFVKKCLNCGEAFQEEVEACPCGSTAFSEPNKGQLAFFKRNGATFLEQANDNGQTLLEVLSAHRFHLDIVDNAYLLAIKSYLYDAEGNIIASIPKEILTVDPREIRKIHGPDGKPGGQFWVCPEHRERPFGKKERDDEGARRCPTCGNVLQEAFYVTTSPKAIYYLEDEIHHKAEYYPSVLYGYPPILKAVDEAMAYHYIEKRARSYYERGRPPGILSIPTRNLEAITALWDKLMAKLKGDPHYVPFINFDPEGKAAQFIKLMDDPGPGLLEVKKELRERLGSRFGVSMIFLADTSTSGGLNNEGLQITVTNRTFQSDQAVYNTSVLPWLVRQFGITDWLLELNPNEEQDLMAEKQRFQLDAQNAQTMLAMGFDVHYENNKFTFSGEARPPTGAPTLPLSPGQSAPEKPAPEGSPPNLHRSTDKALDDELAKFTPPEAGGLPEGGKKILREVYASCRGEWVSAHPKDRENAGNKERCARTAWAAVERAGYSPAGKSESAGKVFEPDKPDELEYLTKDELVKTWTDDALIAIGRGALYPFYEGVAEGNIPVIHAIITGAFQRKEFSLAKMVKAIAAATSLDEAKAEVIARTESASIANKAREIGWERMEREQGERFIYRWSVHHDARTSDICLEIEKRVGGGVEMDRLKEIIKEVSQAKIPGWTGWNSLVAHPNERSTPVRVVVA